MLGRQVMRPLLRVVPEAVLVGLLTCSVGLQGLRQKRHGRAVVDVAVAMLSSTCRHARRVSKASRR